jgi:hypothetical protein
MKPTTPWARADGGSDRNQKSTPGKAIPVINGFLRGLSLHASTLRSFGAARGLLPCRGHA